MNNQKRIYEIVLTGLGIALVFVATLFIKIPNAIDGYFNLGDGFILIFSSFLNPLLAFMVGGLGSALADVAGGYAYYFIPTLIIKGLEGMIVSYLMTSFRKELKINYKLQILAYLSGSTIMVIGYFLAKWFMKGNVYVAMLGIPENIFQAAAGLIVAYIVFPILNNLYKNQYLHHLRNERLL